jgi:hypothetical protein
VKPTIGRPSGFSQEVADKILARMVQGEMLNRICADEGITWGAYYGWMDRRPELREAHARARLAWSDWWAERAIELSVNPERSIEASGKVFVDHAVIGWAKLVTDNIKWLVGKYAPRTYGDKPQVSETPAGALTIRWLANDAPSPEPPQPPKQIEYKPPRLPADLTPEAWGIIVELLELIRRTIPSNSDRPPEEVFGVIRKALLAHFADSK